jgi:hypothetical protein
MCEARSEATAFALHPRAGSAKGYAIACAAAGPFTPCNLLVGYLPQAVVSLRIQHEQLMRLDFHQ